jgi:hypothetical protein
MFSKLYESFAADSLKKTILELIDGQQFGNMNGLSTTHYLVILLDTVYKLLDEPDVWLNLLLIDLQKAFDLISHNVLVDKFLKEFNVPHFLVNIIASFLSNRSQVVKYKNVYSDSLPISCRVPQGTLLGP